MKSAMEPRSQGRRLAALRRRVQARILTRDGAQAAFFLLALATALLAIWSQKARAVPMPSLTDLEVRVWTAEDHELHEVENAIVRAIQLDPYSARAHQLLAQILRRRFTLDPSDMHLLKQASDAAQQAIDLDERSDAGYVALADILDLMGNPDKGLALLDEAERLGLEPSWRFYFTRSRLVADDVDTKKVLGLLETALGFTDSQPRIIIPYVLAILQAGTSGEKLLQSVTSWNERFPSPLFDLTAAITLADLGRHQEAHKLYQTIIRKDPGNREALVNDGILLYRNLKAADKGEAQLARVLASHGRSLSPNVKSMVHAHLGAARLAQRKWDEAASAFAEAVTVDSRNVALLDFITRAYQQANEPRHFANMLRRLNQALPGTGVLHALLAETLSEKLGEHQAALRSYGDAITLDPDRSDYYNGMGLAYYRMKSYEDALRLFVAATEVDPNDATARYNEACVLSILGRRDAAMGRLKDAVALDPRLLENARTDQDFANLRDQPEFRRLVLDQDVGVETVGH